MAELTVLLIEDDARLAHFTALYLERHEVAVTHVTDGAAGLREALRRKARVFECYRLCRRGEKVVFGEVRQIAEWI